jgi:AcrR family transcriptional regulator
MAEAARMGARRRILLTAYDLFSQRGVRNVSVDEIIKTSGVAIATFYRHFSSKNELAAEFLNLRRGIDCSRSSTPSTNGFTGTTSRATRS